MEADFWIERWQLNQIGFHQNEVNGFLRRHWPRLGLHPSDRVLVPLCGKSLDLLWLSQLGHEVVGVELSEKALRDFVAENALQAKVYDFHGLCAYHAENMTLLCADLFHMTPSHTEGVRGVYDRAALIALPPEMRLSYAELMQRLLPEGCVYLLVTMDYDQSRMDGPPFSVSDNEVKQLFAHAKSFEILESVDFERKGLKVREKTWLIRF
ncbi:thiopurine S-methyltransferase [Thiomicrorhabdus sp.]|uniref:thiopurine S-methyltransferase n=1 Tax=Thiomicrorhabdus sp. TaxID=2039724 RepID=UPI0029C9610F|nr:thiopurine S-methyltransferase [Thiomicrorhabdus sp.]